MYTTPVSTIAGPEGTDVRRMPDERINGLRLGPERPPAGKSFKAVRAWTRDRHGSKQGPGIPLRRGPYPVLRPGRREGPEGPALRRRRAVHRTVRDHLVRDVRVAGLDRRHCNRGFPSAVLAAGRTVPASVLRDPHHRPATHRAGRGHR